MLDVQLKQSKYMTSLENVSKSGNFTLKCVKIECLQVKLSMTVYPEQEYYMFTQGGHVFEKLNSEFSLRFPGYFQTFP